MLQSLLILMLDSEVFIVYVQRAVIGGVMGGYPTQNPGSKISLKSEAKKATAACSHIFSTVILKSNARYLQRTCQR